MPKIKDDKIGVESYSKWEQDSVEFFVDPNMPKAGSYDDDDAQVNNDPGTGFRGSIAKWNDVTNNTYESLVGVGVLELVKASEFVE